MSVRVQFRCNGCSAEADGTAPLWRHFEPIWSGSNFGTWRTDSVSDVVPEGWIAWDPYTGVTYCPTCWASIEAEDGPDG